MPKDVEVKHAILEEVHSSACVVPRCLICQQVKPECQTPTGLLNPLPIPKWKWEHVMMNFLFGLPRTQAGVNGVWVIMDRLTKIACDMNRGISIM